MTRIFQLLLAIVAIISNSCNGQKYLNGSAKNCILIESSESARFYSSRDSFHDSSYLVEISRLQGRQRTSDAGFQLAARMRGLRFTDDQVRQFLLKNISIYGLQNWMFSVQKTFDAIAEDELREAAKSSGKQASPFVPMG
jgi:hypothetical protein